MLVGEDCTQFLWEKHSKELDILFFNLINSSEHDVLKLVIKINLKEKNPESALAWTKFPNILNIALFVFTVFYRDRSWDGLSIEHKDSPFGPSLNPICKV